MDRIAASASLSEALKLLTDIGWGEASDRRAFEDLAVRKVAAACAFTRAVTPEPRITDCYLLKYDIANLKIIIKSHVLGIDARTLSACGVYSRDMLKDAVTRGDFRRFPKVLRNTLYALRSGNTAQLDPLRIDAELDKALFALIFSKLRAAREAVVTRYFTEYAEFTNLMIALRCRAMGRGVQCAEGMFVPGGAISQPSLGFIAGGLDSPAKHIGGKPYYPALRKGIDDFTRGNGLALLECEIGGRLLSIIRTHRHDIDSVLPLIWYLLSCEREASLLRLIISAKATHICVSRLVNARMCASYVTG
jgi:V/A-type H+-transporting ATPase subunit C